MPTRSTKDIAKANERHVRRAVRQHEALVAAWVEDWKRQIWPTPSPETDPPQPSTGE